MIESYIALRSPTNDDKQSPSILAACLRAAPSSFATCHRPMTDRKLTLETLWAQVPASHLGDERGREAWERVIRAVMWCQDDPEEAVNIPVARPSPFAGLPIYEKRAGAARAELQEAAFELLEMFPDTAHKDRWRPLARATRAFIRRSLPDADDDLRRRIESVERSLPPQPSG